MNLETTSFELFSSAINSWFCRQQMGLRQGRQWRTLRAAVARAYERFSAQNPQYADSLFDMLFLTHLARPLLERYLTPNPPLPTELAVAWCGQFPTVMPTEAQFAEVTWMAATFLRYLEAELDS